MSQGYDALQAFSKGVWLPLPKRKMNFVPLIVCLGSQDGFVVGRTSQDSWYMTMTRESFQMNLTCIDIEKSLIDRWRSIPLAGALWCLGGCSFWCIASWQLLRCKWPWNPSFFAGNNPQTLTVRPLVLPDPLQPTHSMQHLSLRAFGDCTHHFGQGFGVNTPGVGTDDGRYDNWS